MADDPKTTLRCECSGCLETGRLLMPVREDTIGGIYTARLCLRCRMGYARGAADYAQRIEGRHGRGHAAPLPCSLQSLEFANAADRPALRGVAPKSGRWSLQHDR